MPDALPNEKAVTCGLVMPIGTLDGCSAEHWLEVQAILKDAVRSIPSPRFTARLVSESDEIGVIQKRIVQGLYSSDIVICDVSGKNPNVMFELGMRLAFDKPTVIVKDDVTDYSFDTGIIEHLEYPRDLRFSKILTFKERLAQKVLATYTIAEQDETHSPFLKNFGQFTVANLAVNTTSADKVVIEMLTELQRDFATFKSRAQEHSVIPPPSLPAREVEDGRLITDIVAEVLLERTGEKQFVPRPDRREKLYEHVRSRLIARGGPRYLGWTSHDVQPWVDASCEVIDRLNSVKKVKVDRHGSAD